MKARRSTRAVYPTMNLPSSSRCRADSSPRGTEAPLVDPPYGCQMGNKSTPSSQPKKPSRTLKEKRAAKHAKEDAQKQVRKGWDVK